MGNDLNNAMDSTGGNNQYDEAAKRILGNKEVLSHILTNTVDEYKKMKPEDVIPLIEGDPYISIVPVEPGLTNAEKTVNGERIVGFNLIPEKSPTSIGSGMNPVFLYVKSFFSEISHIYRRKIFMRKEKRADATESI